MQTFIQRADLNVLEGRLSGSIEFAPGLNIVCGENGTLKTKLLQSLKGNLFVSSNPQRPPRIQAISPKRNSERRTWDAALQFVRQNNRSYDTFVGEAEGQPLNDHTFSNYPSLGELFLYIFDKKCRDGQAPITHMRDVEREFNETISRVFPEYRLVAEWTAQGRPSVQVEKRGTMLVPIHLLSLGEQEVLALIANIYAARDAHDVFLIDEPEVHLNWSLEERLFGFFDFFCATYQRQIVAVTHSRAVFLPQFIKKVTFLVWTPESRVVPTKEISPEQRRRIAGEAISVLHLGGSAAPSAYVEDTAHETIIRRVAEKLGVVLSVAVCGNKSNVRSLYKRLKMDDGLDKTVFVEDGDGEGAPPFAGESFVHLDKYCFENYLLDSRVAAHAFAISEDEFRSLILGKISLKRSEVLGRNKFLEFLLAQLRQEHLTEDLLSKLDASVVVPSIAASFGLTFEDYVERYVNSANALGLLGEVFPADLLGKIRQMAVEDYPPVAQPA
jgi:hypothetical protein